jgi:hypothetical protein
MNLISKRQSGWANSTPLVRWALSIVPVLLMLVSPGLAHGGKLSWLDDVVQDVIVEQDPQVLRTFEALAPAEKRLVVELGETAQILARRYPANAEAMVRRLGPEGMSAVRVFGDDVALVLVKEGPESLGVLRKAGRGGWSFFTKTVLPNKKKLAAAGVLAVFLANPEKFVDYAGRATELAVREFARAGIQLASAAGLGAARGLETSIGETLSAYGLNFPILRWLGMGLAGIVAASALLIVLGLPVRWLLRPFTILFRPIGFPFNRLAVHRNRQARVNSDVI